MTEHEILENDILIFEEKIENMQLKIIAREKLGWETETINIEKELYVSRLLELQEQI